MIVKLNDLSDVRRRHYSQKLVLTSGTYDLFHAGHLSYLEGVKNYGDVIVVLLSGDERVKARKGPERPIIHENDRARILDSLKLVDYVIIDPSRMNPSETDPVHAEVLNALQPDLYVTDGPDPRFVKLLDKDKFIILNRSAADISTTDIIEHIRKSSSRGV